ncbi:Gallate 1-beta-glucosyltransferase, partial [Cucurbita argyrosperma subsp. sororia]
MTSMDSLPHVFLVSFPGQGHINPMLRLGKKLAATGLLVTFSTTANAGHRMKNAGSISDDPTPLGNGFLRFEFFDDGLTDTSPAISFDQYMPQLRRLGEISLLQILKNQTKENRPVACVIGNPFVPWVCDVADHLGISSAVLWVQSLAVLSIYYHHFHGSVPFPSETQPNLDVQLPCLPLLKYDEIPSFLLPNDIYHTIGKTILDQFSNLSNPFCILIDTFEELEAEIVEYMSKIFPIKTVGPLFKNCNEIKTSISGDCLRIDECMEWLDSKPKGSVVYVSFGSVVYLKQEQVDEIAYGLLNSGFCFLWVLKPPASNLEVKRHVLPKELTNAKFLIDVFGVGLRLSRGVGEDRVIKRDEIEKCLREAMEGPKAVEIKQKAVERQMAAEKAVAEGGSSDRNFKHFIDEIRKRSIGCGERFHVTCPYTT